MLNFALWDDPHNWGSDPQSLNNKPTWQQLG